MKSRRANPSCSMELSRASESPGTLLPANSPRRAFQSTLTLVRSHPASTSSRTLWHGVTCRELEVFVVGVEAQLAAGNCVGLLQRDAGDGAKQVLRDDSKVNQLWIEVVGWLFAGASNAGSALRARQSRTCSTNDNTKLARSGWR